MAASDFWNAFKSSASNLATAYDNKVKEKQRETYLKRLALDKKYGSNLAEGMYQGDYNLRKLIKDVSPIGAAMNVGSALEEGDYKKAGLNVGLLGLEALPVGKALSKVGAPLANRVLRDKDMLVPALTDKDYTKLFINETLMGKAPLAGKSAGAATALTKKRYKPSGISDLEIALREYDPKFKDAQFIFTGQNRDFAEELADFSFDTKKNIFTGPDPQVAGQYAMFDNHRPGLPGRLVAFPIEKDFNISSLLEKSNPLKVPESSFYVTGSDGIRRPVYKSITSPLSNRALQANPDNKWMKDQWIFTPDNFRKLQSNVIGRRGLVLPNMSAADKPTMQRVAEEIKKKSKTFEDL